MGLELLMEPMDLHGVHHLLEKLRKESLSLSNLTDRVPWLHVVHSPHHLLLLLLLLHLCLLILGAHLALGDVRREGVARLPGGLNRTPLRNVQGVFLAVHNSSIGDLVTH